MIQSLPELLHAIFSLPAGVTLYPLPDGDFSAHLHHAPTPRGCIDFARYGPTPEAALTAALNHAHEVARDPTYLPPPATDLLTLLGIQPAAKPKPVGTIRRL